MKLTSFLQLASKLQQAGKIDKLQQACGVFGWVADLEGASQPLPSTLAAIEKLVCLLYLPGTQISSVKEHRWFLFRRKQAESERLPPTKAALKHVILHAFYQAMVWKDDIIPNPRLPSPAGFGWTLQKGNSSKAYHRESAQNNIKL